MREDGKIKTGSVSITFEEFSSEEIELFFETDIVEKGGYIYPEFTITSISFKGEKLESGPFFDLIVYLMEDKVYHEIKGKAKD